MNYTKELIVQITDVIGIHFINKEFNTVRLEITARLDALNEKMIPDKSSDVGKTYVIDKEIVENYQKLRNLQDSLMEWYEEQEVELIKTEDNG